MLWGIPADFVLYGVCLGLSLILAFLSAVSGSAFDVDVDVDGDVDTSFDSGRAGHGVNSSAGHGLPRYSLLNPVALLAFLGGFGAAGFISRGVGMGVWSALVVALVAGLLFSLLLFQIFVRVVLTSEGSVAPALEEAVGKLATVTLTIPVAGLGAVAYVVAGQRQTIAARQQGEQPIPAGAEVVIIDLQQNVAIVRPFIYR